MLFAQHVFDNQLPSFADPPALGAWLMRIRMRMYMYVYLYICLYICDLPCKVPALRVLDVREDEDLLNAGLFADLHTTFVKRLSELPVKTNQ